MQRRLIASRNMSQPAAGAAQSSSIVSEDMTGKHVRLKNLVTSAQYNGLLGTVLKQLENGRLFVKLEQGIELSLSRNSLDIVDNTSGHKNDTTAPNLNNETTSNTAKVHHKQGVCSLPDCLKV